MTSTYPIGTLGSVTFLLAATLYQGNPQALEYLIHREIYIYTPYASTAGMLQLINGRFTMERL